MKVSGFTLVRNAIKYDYPVVESIQSILPLCDEVVVAVGNSDDATLDLIKSIHPTKIRIIETVWDDTLREGGRVLAVETDKAFCATAADSDWCFYIQADEVIHEKYHDTIHATMLQWKDDPSVDGLLFNYLHFYGAYEYVADAYNWYRKEIRIVRRNNGVYSHGDAQGFRKKENEKLCVKLIDAYVYHYGWVKDPQAQQRKQETFHLLWHDEKWVEKHITKTNKFDYSQIDSLQLFGGTHPTVMLPRIARQDWTFVFDVRKSKMKWKYRLRRWIEQNFGWSVGEYRNYKQL
jgi:glycosyltransferase involved in cell wall biosynthesis